MFSTSMFKASAIPATDGKVSSMIGKPTKPLFEQVMPMAMYGWALGSWRVRRRAHSSARPRLSIDPATYAAR